MTDFFYLVDWVLCSLHRLEFFQFLPQVVIQHATYQLVLSNVQGTMDG